jgi:hypothetical protein
MTPQEMTLKEKQELSTGAGEDAARAPLPS